MSINKAWISIDENVQKTLRLYREAPHPTVRQLMIYLGVSEQTVQATLKRFMPQAEYKALKALRKSRSRQGEKNPMWNRTGARHPNWIGIIDDGYGYLTCMKDGERQFVHRIVMAEALGLPVLPESLVVHHIDGDPKNNSLDNLALTTDAGHKQIHFLQVKDTLSVTLKKSTLWEAFQSMTSQSKKTKAT